jgi:hypothetical protein
MNSVMVYAHKYYNLAESALSPGDKIQISVCDCDRQVWKNVCVQCDENGRDYGCAYWNTMARMRGAPVGSLVAAICECGAEANDDCLVKVGSGVTHVVGGDPAKKYCVYLFANDMPLFYWNNSGAISVRVKVTRRNLFDIHYSASAEDDDFVL